MMKQLRRIYIGIFALSIVSLISTICIILSTRAPIILIICAIMFLSWTIGCVIEDELDVE
jgi:hypothetical protein